MGRLKQVFPQTARAPARVLCWWDSALSTPPQERRQDCLYMPGENGTLLGGKAVPEDPLPIPL